MGDTNDREQGRPHPGRPLPRLVPNPGQDQKYPLLMHDQGTTPTRRPTYSYDPERRAGDVVPHVEKLYQSESRPKQGEDERPATGKHRAPRRGWLGRGSAGGIQMRMVSPPPFPAAG